MRKKNLFSDKFSNFILELISTIVIDIRDLDGTSSAQLIRI
jgi:hypothetical protein